MQLKYYSTLLIWVLLGVCGCHSDRSQLAAMNIPAPPTPLPNVHEYFESKQTGRIDISQVMFSQVTGVYSPGLHQTYWLRLIDANKRFVLQKFKKNHTVILNPYISDTLHPQKKWLLGKRFLVSNVGYRRGDRSTAYVDSTAATFYCLEPVKPKISKPL